ncbi:MAG TPA: type II toxin-antitoxin system VapB family antitoxin [Thermoanaerobaculia bacterium]|nr:type II toxin-antitoxin system VapB family antitoxin [Thermoanaerobaculia bacterium]
MPTTLTIDDQLLQEAQRLGGHRTAREAVTAALGEYVQRRSQRRILELFGTIDFARGYDYKRQRRRH